MKLAKDLSFEHHDTWAGGSCSLEGADNENRIIYKAVLSDEAFFSPGREIKNRYLGK